MYFITNWVICKQLAGMGLNTVKKLSSEGHYNVVIIVAISGEGHYICDLHYLVFTVSSKNTY